MFRDRRETRSGCFTGSKDTGDALADLRPIGISVKFKLDSTKGGGDLGSMEWWDAAFYKTLVWCGCAGGSGCGGDGRGDGCGGVVVVEEGVVAGLPRVNSRLMATLRCH